MTIDELKQQIVDFCIERDWGQFHNPKDLAISLSLESAEVLEHFQWKSEEEIKQHIEAKRGEVSEELADVLYWVLLLGHNLDIDLSQAFLDKMDKNRQKYPIEMAKGKHTKYTELNKTSKD